MVKPLRQCRCGYQGPVEEFQKKRANGTIRELTTCPACRDYHRAWQQLPEVLVKRADKRATLEWRINQRAQHLWDKYKITLADFDRMLLEQSGRCGICEDPFPQEGPHVDHGHVSGNVRELLCPHCNWMLGGAKDRAHVLVRGAEYLRKYGS